MYVDVKNESDASYGTEKKIESENKRTSRK